MGGSSSQTPAPPNYTAAAQATAQGSQQQATQQNYANRPTVNTPFGSRSWDTSSSIDPSTGKPVTSWTQNNTLDPGLQQALNSQIDIQNQRSGMAQGLFGQLSDQYSKPMDFSGMQDWGSTPSTPFGLTSSIDTSGVSKMPGSSQDYMDKAENQLYSGYTRRLGDQFGRQEDAMNSSLVNSGFAPGSAGWSGASKDQAYKENDAYQGAATQAQAGAAALGQQMYRQDMGTHQQGMADASAQATFGNAAQQQAYGQSQQNSQYQNSLRSQQLQESLQKRGYSLAEVNSLLSGQNVSMPQFSNTGGAVAGSGTDYTGAATSQYGAAADAFNAQQAQQQSRNQTSQNLISTGALMFMMSDRRLKRKVRRIGRLPSGISVYRYKFKGGKAWHTGVMAQEVARVLPHAVMRGTDGYLRVNYTEVLK